MISEPQTRELLLDSFNPYSMSVAESRILAELNSPEFVSLLVRIAVDADDYGGDAPKAAAYYLSKARPSLIQPHEASLLELLVTANGYAGSVAIVLGRMRSQQAKPLIAHMLSDDWWPEEAYTEALSYYDA